MFSRARNVSSSVYQTLKYIWDGDTNTLLILACCKILNSWITDNCIIVHCDAFCNRLQRAKFLIALWFQNFIWVFSQRVLKDSVLQPRRWMLSWDNPGATGVSTRLLLSTGACAAVTPAFLPPFTSKFSTQEVMPYPATELPPVPVWGHCDILSVSWHCDTTQQGAGHHPDSVSTTWVPSRAAGVSQSLPHSRDLSFSN